MEVLNVFHPRTFARPVRTLAETSFAEGRRLQTLVTTWDDDGRLVRREMFDADGKSGAVTMRRYDEPGFVETERTENARGELLGHRRVTRTSGGELVSEAWNTYPANVFQIDGMQFSVRDAARSVYRFTQDERFIGAQLIDAGNAVVAVITVSYDERGRRTHVVCDAPPVAGEIRYRHDADALTAELMWGERVTAKHVTFARDRLSLEKQRAGLLLPFRVSRWRELTSS